MPSTMPRTMPSTMPDPMSMAISHMSNGHERHDVYQRAWGATPAETSTLDSHGSDIDMCVNMCIDMCMDMCIGMCVDTCV